MDEQRYLWDKRGPPDPFVVKLEHALTSKRAALVQPMRSPRRRIVRMLGYAILAAAAAVVVGLYWGRDTGKSEAAPPFVVETQVAPHPSTEAAPVAAPTEDPDALREVEENASAERAPAAVGPAPQAVK